MNIVVTFAIILIANIDYVLSDQVAVKHLLSHHVTILGPTEEVNCSGAIIAPRFILTTTSCIARNATDLLIVVGLNKFNGVKSINGISFVE